MLYRICPVLASLSSFLLPYITHNVLLSIEREMDNDVAEWVH